VKDKTLINIVKKITDTNNMKITRMKHEEDESYYNVWLVESNCDRYILKQSSLKEIDVYSKVESNFIPRYIGSTIYYNKQYILIGFLDGYNLMKTNKDELKVAIDSLISIQKKYLNSKLEIGLTYDECFEKVLNRKKYLFDYKLEKVYEFFINVFKDSIKTFVHFDLLPFNVIVSNDKGVFIDLEYAGILPYPFSICRLLAHYKEEEDYLFYLKEEDKGYLIKYYYDNFIKYLDVNYESYFKTINYFMFYEFTEWIFVYNKYGLEKDDRFNYYYQKANLLADYLLRSQEV
jgi:hypothetical protein